MSRDARLVLALAAASLLATGAAGVLAVYRLVAFGSWLGSRPAAEVEASAPQDPIPYAEVEQATAAPPARFAARLPRVQEFGEAAADRFPPPAHVRDLLCAGDAEMWRRAREALAGSGEVTVAQVADTYGDLLRYCEGDGCFAAALLGQGDRPAAALPAWMALTHCPSAEADAAFRRPDAPALAVLARANVARWGVGEGATVVHPPPLERLLPAAVEVIQGGPRGTAPNGARNAAFELARAGPRGVEALLGLHAKVREPKLRRDLAMALSEADDPRARAIWKRSCAADANDPACSREEAGGDAEPATPAPALSPAIPGLAARLQGMGLLPAGSAVEQAGDTSETLLLAARRGYQFDAETDQFPNEHDSLLRSLAALAGDGLKGALYEEVAPGEDDEEGDYLLRAYLGGERYQATARNLGDWYDVEAAVGLLNAVARARRLEVRWLILPSSDQTATVLAGPEKGLRDALAAELLAAGGADEAMGRGKAFEEQVRGQLQEEGQVTTPAPPDPE